MLVYENFRFLAGCFSVYLLAFICTKWEYYLCIQILKPKLCQMSLPYLPICRIFMSLSKFVCANSNFKINFLFVCPCRSWSDRGWPIFSMLDILFSRWVFIHLSLHESVAKVIGMPNPEMIFCLCCSIINSLESVGMEGTRGYA